MQIPISRNSARGVSTKGELLTDVRRTETDRTTSAGNDNDNDGYDDANGSWLQLPQTDSSCWDAIQTQDASRDDVLTWIVCVRGDLRARPASFRIHRRILEDRLPGLPATAPLVTELPAEEAARVPDLLDCMYRGDLPEEDHDELPHVALYRLAHRLGARAVLQAVADRYAERVLTMANFLEVIRTAEKLPGSVDDSPLRDAALSWAAARLGECTPARARRVPPDILLQVLTRNQQLGVGRRMEPLVMSKLVSHCLSRSANPRLTTTDTLDAITDEALVPFLHPAFEAPTLLLADCVIRKQKEENSISAANENENANALTSLQDRCLQSMGTYWHTCYAGFSSSASLNLNLNLSESNFSPAEAKQGQQSPARGRLVRRPSTNSLMSNLSGNTHGGFQRDVADQALLDYLQYLPRHVVQELHDKTTAKSCTCLQQRRRLKSPAGMSLMTTGVAFPYGRTTGLDEWGESGEEDEEDLDESGEDTFDVSAAGPSKPSSFLRKPASKDELARCLLESVKHLKIKSTHSNDETTVTETDTHKSDEYSLEHQQDNQMVDSYFDDLLDSSSDEDDDDDDMGSTSIFRSGNDFSHAVSPNTSFLDDITLDQQKSLNSSDDEDDDLLLMPITEHYDDFLVHNLRQKEEQELRQVQRRGSH